MQENVSLKEVFDHLKCTKDGLSSDEVKERLDLFGYNKLEEKKVRKQSLSMSVQLYACSGYHCSTAVLDCSTFLFLYRKANF